MDFVIQPGTEQIENSSVSVITIATTPTMRASHYSRTMRTDRNEPFLITTEPP